MLGPPGTKLWAALLQLDRKSTRLNSSHLVISYAVFCLKKKKLLAFSYSSDDYSGHCWLLSLHVTSDPVNHTRYMPVAFSVARYSTTTTSTYRGEQCVCA